MSWGSVGAGRASEGSGGSDGRWVGSVGDGGDGGEVVVDSFGGVDFFSRRLGSFFFFLALFLRLIGCVLSWGCGWVLLGVELEAVHQVIVAGAAHFIRW